MANASIGACPTTAIDKAFCSLVAATTISRSYTDWACTATGQLLKNPCEMSGISCNNGHVVQLSIYDGAISGELTPLIYSKFVFFLL